MLIPDEQLLIAKANECLQQANYLGLANNLTQLITLHPENPDYHFQLAEAYSQLLKVHSLNKYYSNALNHYHQAIKLAPQEALYYAKRAEHYLIKGHRYQALEDFGAAIERAPNNIHYYEQRAPLASALGKIALAIDDYQRLAQANPENASLPHKIKELQQSLPSVRLSPAATPSSADVSRDKLNQLLAQRKRVKAVGIAWKTAIAASGLVIIAGAILSALGLLAIGLPLIGLGGVGCALTTIKAIYNQLEKHSLDKKIEAENRVLYRVPLRQVTDYATFSSQPSSPAIAQQRLSSPGVQTPGSYSSSDDFIETPSTVVKTRPNSLACV